MRNALIALTMAATPGMAVAQETDASAQRQAAEAACVEAGGCRVVEQLRVQAPDGEVTTIDVGITIPWLTQGNVMLTPGEAVTIALQEIEGILVPSLISTGPASRDTPLEEGQVRFDFGGFENGRLILTVLSQYPANIDFGALKATIGAGPDRTSVCTLVSGVPSIEIWQEPIYQLALFGFRPASGHACHIIDSDSQVASTHNGPA